MTPEVASDNSNGKQQCVWIGNAEQEPLIVCMEPWGNEILLSSGKSYLVVFNGPDGHCPEVQWSKDRITVFGWSGSVAAVYLEGELVLSCARRVPPVPTLR